MQIAISRFSEGLAIARPPVHGARELIPAKVEPPALTPEKVDVLKAVYTEEAEALRFEVATAQRLMTYFATLEVAFAAWILGHAPADYRLRWFLSA